MKLPEIDFHRIRSVGTGGQREAFEQFVCELAADDPPDPDARFVRILGAGGDGGVECFWTCSDGSEHGWQAKFWTENDEVDKAQLDASVETALKVHPRLTRYTIAVPVDPTGPTARAGKSLYERVYDTGGWRDGWKASAAAREMSVEFVVEWQTDITTRLGRSDVSGARTRYWFDANVLTDKWWSDRLADAVEAARPRYIPELTVEVPAATAFGALCGDPSWRQAVDGRSTALESTIDHAKYVSEAASMVDRSAIVDAGREALAKLRAWAQAPDPASRSRLDDALTTALASVSDAERVETEAMDNRHGDWDRPSWRQFQAEYQQHFPAGTVDWLRDVKKGLDDLRIFLTGPLENVFGARTVLITGPAGTGKTFVTCDVVARRVREGRPSAFVHGRWFTGGDPLIDLRDRLHLPHDLTGEEVLALLDQAGRAAGAPVLLVLDALNESRPRTMWRDQLDRVVTLANRYDHLRVVFTVRSHYRPQTVPDSLDIPTFEHRGFQGVEFEAVTEYADYYGLEPPTSPPVHGEFSNPLFLRLLCQALRDRGRLALTQASMGINDLVELLLDATNDRVSDQLDAPRRDRIVHQAMMQVAKAIGTGTKPWLDRTDAMAITRALWPDHTAERSLLEALISEGLLAEDLDPDGTDGGNVVGIAFERLGHHLIIAEATSKMTTAEDVNDGLRNGSLRHLLGLEVTPDPGLLEALSVVVAHRFTVELDSVADAIGDRATILAAVIAGLPWRSADSITEDTRQVVLAALGSQATFAEAMDTLFRLAPLPEHPLNADLLHELLAQHSMPARDAYLVPWLHETHGTGGAVDRLIAWARDRDIDGIGADSCRHWVTTLLWCTGCPDRRVRDGATLAAARLLVRHPAQASGLLRQFLDVDDDWIVERVCYVAYSALLRSGGDAEWAAAAQAVWEAVFADAVPENAAIRDEARSIIEAAHARGVSPAAVDLARVRPPHGSDWPSTWPDDDDLAKYDRDAYPKLVYSCTGDDFFSYQISPAFRDFDGIEPDRAARRIVQDVVEMGYEPRLHAAFDVHVLNTYGSGRSKPAWIERIGKKYQWIALARLIGVVSDHETRKRSQWDPPPPPTPEPYTDRLRQLDPTVHEPGPATATPPPCIPEYDWSKATAQPAANWIADETDIPDVPVDNLGDPESPQVLLTGSYEWEEPEQPDGTHKRIWADTATLFVATSDLKALLAELAGEELVGHDLFRPPRFDCFVGEYPYGHHYEAQNYVARYEAQQFFAVPTMPGSEDVYSEYEYASGTMETVSLDAPTSAMFGPAPGALRWNGRDGWVGTDGRMIATIAHVFGRWEHNQLTIDRCWFNDWLQMNDLTPVWVEMAGKNISTWRMDGSAGSLERTRVRYRVGDAVQQLDTVCERTPPRPEVPRP